MSVISVEGMEFYAYHGCIREEAIIGTKFLVDIFIETDTLEAEETDELRCTLNYQEVYLVVKEQMEIRSNLLEHVGRRILQSLRKKHPEINDASLKISKMNPPVGGRVERVSLQMKLNDA
ncbi:MAG: dihydroneopterin aldolase [Bacteroidales bacterium]|nr:dihydroneopterin aldolase [Bacteroidales bacterium]MCF8386439.1 dihydroneopterin aldolase [Bacteroidales bacterium]MCF8397817.1 dihydroneopterin aldolase [Bacteroidales bacterium]